MTSRLPDGPSPDGQTAGEQFPAGTRVTMIHATETVPVIAQATVSSAEGGVLVAALEGGARLPEGARVIVEGGGQRAFATVTIQGGTIQGGTSQGGATVTLRMERVPARDHREYPRLVGQVALRYRVARGAGDPAGRDDVEAWMRGVGSEGEMYAPDPFMNFSATGLAFDDAPRARANDLLLAAFSLPGSEEQFRALARVVRAWPIPEAEREGPSHRIAVVFEKLGERATEALTAYTLRIQEAMLGDGLEGEAEAPPGEAPGNAQDR